MNDNEQPYWDHEVIFNRRSVKQFQIIKSNFLLIFFCITQIVSVLDSNIKIMGVLKVSKYEIQQ